MSRTKHHGDKAKERVFGDLWWWYKSEPKWWNKAYHIKPRRAENKKLIHRVLRGDYEQTWPPGNRKPHAYYW